MAVVPSSRVDIAIEFEGPRGSTVQFYRIGELGLTIGRAFSNEVHVSDARVDPIHLRIEAQDDGALYLRDLDTVNGTTVDGARLRGVAAPLSTGARVQIGKTRLRVFRRDHQVPPALRPSSLEQLRDVLSTRGSMLLITGIALALVLLQSYLHVGGDYKAEMAVRGTMAFAAGTGTWMLFWSAVSKLIRGEFAFRAHWCVGAAMAAAAAVLDEVVSVLAFNGQSLTLFKVLDGSVTALVLTTAIYLALTFATHLHKPVRIASATLPAAVLLLTTYVLPLLDDDPQVHSPRMLSLSRPPALQFASARDPQRFVDATRQLFDEVDRTASEELAEEREQARRRQPPADESAAAGQL